MANKKRRKFLQEGLGASLLCSPLLSALGLFSPQARGQVVPFAFYKPRILVLDANSSGQTIPAAAKAGNYAVLFDAIGGTGTQNYVLPAGWSQRHSDFYTGSLDFRFVVSSKILLGGDPGSSVTGMVKGGIGSPRKILLVFDGNYASVTHSTTVSEQTAGDPASQAIASSAGAGVVVAISSFFAYSGGGGAALSFTPAYDNIFTKGNVRAAYKAYTSGAQDHTVDMPDAGNPNMFMSYYADLSLELPL